MCYMLTIQVNLNQSVLTARFLPYTYTHWPLYEVVFPV